MGQLRVRLRSLAKAPGFAAVVVVTLALGIGANTALFSVVNGVLLNPLPYAQPNQLVALYEDAPGFKHAPITYLNFLDWQRQTSTLASMALYRGQDYSFTGIGQAERLSGDMISAGFFRTLGVAPILGRTFTAADDQLGAAPVAIIGGGLWKSRFGSSPAVLGQAMDLNGVMYSVVGVVPASFSFYGISHDVYTPIGQWKDPSFRDRSVDMSAHAVGRLRDGVTLAQARADMDGVARNLARAYPGADKGVGIALVSLKTDLVGAVQPYLLVLLAAVGFVLLIACGNVANLMLARATGQSVEFAIRAALGASQARILRQLLAESLLLAGLGGALGLALAAVAKRGILALLPATLPRAGGIALDARVLWFTLAVSLLAGLIFGCVPAWRMSRTDPLRVLKSGTGVGGGRSGLQGALVSAEIALAVVLLVGAGLMLRTLTALGRVNPGYQPSHAITFDLSLPATPATTSAQTRARLRAFDAAIRALPGVEAVSVTLGARPMIHDSALPFWIEGRPKPANTNDMPQALFYLAEAGYRQAMGLTLERGRFLADSDNEHAAPVIVIDDVFARQYFPHQDPVGQQVNFAIFGERARIVGVVGHVKQWGLQADPRSAIEPEFFYPFMQLPEVLMPLAADSVAVVLRTRDAPDAIIGPVRGAVHAVDPREVVYSVQTLDGLIANSLGPRRSTMLLLEIFGGLALGLASLGIYGVIAYVVGRRQREIGLRVALGGQPRDVLRLVLGDTLRLALWGLGPGLVAALLLARLLSGLWFGVSATDPATYLAVALLLLAVALLAGCLPARRALRISPLAALRSE